MNRSGLILLTVLLLTAAPPVAAQQRGEAPRFAIEAFGGASIFGRFLEQRVSDAVLPAGGPAERELNAETAVAVGGALNLRLWEKTTVRAGLTFSPTEFEFEDDSGLGGDADDAEDGGLVDLNVFTAELSALGLLGPSDLRVRPYGVAGVTGTWWSLDEGEEDILVDGARAVVAGADDDTQFRVGVIGGVGVQIQAGEGFLVRLEAGTIQSRNPFDGEDAFRATGGETFDEPERVSTHRVTLSLAYAFGGG